MRYCLPLLCAALLLGTAFAAFACGGDDGESTATPASAAPDADDFQATIDAALARIAATRAFSAGAGAQSPDMTPAATTAPTAGRPTGGGAVRPSPTPAAVMPTPSVDPAVYDLAQIRNWEYAGQNAASAVARIRSIGWIVDGLQTAAEFNAAERLVNIAIDAPATLDILLDNHTLVDGLRPLDLPALLSLQQMARYHQDQLKQITDAGWFQDGLTPAEAAIVAALYKSPEFDAIISDPATLTVTMGETRNGAGVVVPIAVIRSGGVPAGSPVMGAAQIAVPIFEGMFAAPLPTPAMVFHITPDVANHLAGANYQTHITLKPDIDDPDIDGNDRTDFSAHAVFHEIAHYYLYTAPEWYAEGGAEFAASYARQATQGAPIDATNSPCAAAASLSELERRLPNSRQAAQSDEYADLWGCHYSLGERLMLALWRELGEERFLQGWRALYAELLREPSYPAQHDFSETDLRVAWLRAGGMTGQPALEHIWDLWYRGSADRPVVEPADSGAVDAALPSINGRIDNAYIALQQLGGGVSSFAAGEVSGWVYLTLEYSYDLSGGSTQEVGFEVAEHYQDGFAYRRRSLDIEATPGYAGGTQWLSVGPMPPDGWAPGRYWVYVHEGGRKVAEVAFEVTP